MSIIVRPIVAAIKGVVNLLFEWIVGAFIYFISFILDIIFNVIGSFVFPDFNNYATIVNNFWDYVFQFIGWFRSAFLIDKVSMQMIMIILVMKLTYKPIISIIKMFVEWYNKLKI